MSCDALSPLLCSAQHMQHAARSTQCPTLLARETSSSAQYDEVSITNPPCKKGPKRKQGKKQNHPQVSLHTTSPWRPSRIPSSRQFHRRRLEAAAPAVTVTIAVDPRCSPSHRGSSRCFLRSRCTRGPRLSSLPRLAVRRRPGLYCMSRRTSSAMGARAAQDGRVQTPNASAGRWSSCSAAYSLTSSSSSQRRAGGRTGSSPSSTSRPSFSLPHPDRRQRQRPQEAGSGALPPPLLLYRRRCSPPPPCLHS